MLDEVRRDSFGAVGGEDSLLSHMELSAGAVSSTLHDSDLRKVDALSVEEALALLLQEPLLYVPVPLSFLFFIVSVLLTDFFWSFCRWLRMRKVWQGGPALPRALSGR